MKTVLFLALSLTSLSAFAVESDAPDYNRKRAIALVDAKLLGEREFLGLSMDRYRIVSDAKSKNGNVVTVGVSGPGGECRVRVNLRADGRIEISDQSCPSGS